MEYSLIAVPIIEQSSQESIAEAAPKRARDTKTCGIIVYIIMFIISTEFF
jgi:hypothetical protein